MPRILLQGPLEILPCLSDEPRAHGQRLFAGPKGAFCINGGDIQGAALIGSGQAGVAGIRAAPFGSGQVNERGHHQRRADHQHRQHRCPGGGATGVPGGEHRLRFGSNRIGRSRPADEPIPGFRHGGDVARIGRVVVQRPAGFLDATRQRTLGHHHVRPEPFHQRLAGDQIAGVFHQADDQLQRPGLHGQRPAVPGQLPLHGIQHKRAEADRCRQRGVSTITSRVGWH